LKERQLVGVVSFPVNDRDELGASRPPADCRPCISRCFRCFVGVRRRCARPALRTTATARVASGARVWAPRWLCRCRHKECNGPRPKKGPSPRRRCPQGARLPNRQAVRDNYNDASSSVTTRAFTREFVFFLKSGFGLSTLIAVASRVFLR